MLPSRGQPSSRKYLVRVGRNSSLSRFRFPEPAASRSGPGDAIYELRTAGGSHIIWGRAPGSDHPGELTYQQKVGRLEDYATRNAGFSDEHGPYEIDIRHWHEITRQPLSELPGSGRQ